MTVKITATAPTIYQLNSLSAFNIGTTKNGNGSYSGSETFGTIKEARQYLKDKAVDYYEGDKRQIQRNLGKNSLTIDAVTAHIEKPCRDYMIIDGKKVYHD